MANDFAKMFELVDDDLARLARRCAGDGVGLRALGADGISNR
jgi:hypothetical protein